MILNSRGPRDESTRVLLRGYRCPMSTSKHSQIYASPHHHRCYQPAHSTTTLLKNLTQVIHEGLNKKKPSQHNLLCAIDISKAVDTVPRHVLINKIHNRHIHPNNKKWIVYFLSGRLAQSTISSHHEHAITAIMFRSPSIFNAFIQTCTYNNETAAAHL